MDERKIELVESRTLTTGIICTSASSIRRRRKTTMAMTVFPDTHVNKEHHTNDYLEVAHKDEDVERDGANLSQ